MTIRTTVTETKVVDRELELPYFGINDEYGKNYYAVTSKNHVLKVYHTDKLSIVMRGAFDSFEKELAKTTPISRDEFLNVYMEARLSIEPVNEPEAITEAF